ncbi:MAG: hypothetical protein ACREHG_02235 [Candidatus Saccharimonadales bacterium]
MDISTIIRAAQMLVEFNLVDSNYNVHADSLSFLSSYFGLPSYERAFTLGTEASLYLKGTL